jgi:hypothetical protein
MLETLERGIHGYFPFPARHPRQLRKGSEARRTSYGGDYFDDWLTDELDAAIDEILADFEGVDEFLTASQMSRAVERNRALATQLRWQPHYDAIIRLLASTGCLQPNYTPGWEDLSEAVACWQQRQGLTADGIIGRNTWRRMQTALGITSSTLPPTSSGIHPQVIERIAQYDTIINRVAAAQGIDPNWIRGVIATESGGKPNSGEGSSGYKGLMQAGTTNEQLDPETSIRTGTQKLKKFRKSVIKLLRRYGIKPSSLKAETMIQLTMVAYNAGPGTLSKAMEYASNAGDVNQWFEPEFFQRALIYYGAYSLRVLKGKKSPLKQMTDDGLVTELRQLTGMSQDKIREKYWTRRGWNIDGLRAAIIKQLNQVRLKLRKQNLTLKEVRRSTSPLILYATEFKHNNLRTWYVDRVVSYMRYYQRQ